MATTEALPDIDPPPAASAQKVRPKEQSLVKFGKSEGFMQALRKRVDAYFEETGLSRRDQPRMYVKTAIILTWLIGSYAALVFWASSWPVALLLSVSLGVAMAAVGFNIMHDGAHGAYSRSSFVNHAMAFTLDVLGGSSILWKRTHNVIHHSYTNVTGIDGDIDLGIMGRLSPHQEHRSFHRYQHLYLWFLYGLITFKWQFYDDFQGLLTGKIGGTRIPAFTRNELILTITGKVLFFALAFALPLYLHSWYSVALCFLAASFAEGLLLSVVFQLAHCVEHADFPLPDESSQRIENDWAIHQVETTVDFARRNPVVTWYAGGLNYQIEHHLFPQICHLHYPALAKIVEDTAEDFGVNYHAHPTMLSAVRSHYNWLKTMGQSASAMSVS